jgi:hypothetical protein
MKFQPFFFRKFNGKNISSPSTLKGNQVPSDTSNSESDECSNQGNVSFVAQKNGCFIFRKIKRDQSHHHTKNYLKNKGNLQPPVNNRNFKNHTTSTSGTTAKTSIVDRETPVSFICLDSPVPTNSLPERPLHKRSSATIIRMHGLDRDDSIVSYMKEVDDAYNQMVIICENDTDNDEKRNDDDDYDDEQFYMDRNEMEKSISILTMDPALLYRHSIIIDEYSWKSFAIDENDDDESTRITPIPYFEI